MNNKLEVIGIDHGWSMMKTISQVFVTGVRGVDEVKQEAAHKEAPKVRDDKAR